jgi:hypothetical protein
MSLDRDLGRWEIGEISPEELERLHPDTAVAALVALHERLSTIANEEVPDTEAAMERMLLRLPDRAGPARRRSSRVLLLTAAAVLLTASMAVAMPGVRSSVTGLAHGVGRLFGADPASPPGPAPATIEWGHPGAPGGRGVHEDLDATGAHEPGSGDGDEQSGDPSETSGSVDDQDGSSGTAGGESSGGSGGSDDQGGDGQGSDGENTGGDGADQGSQATDGQTSDGQTEQN